MHFYTTNMCYIEAKIMAKCRQVHNASTLAICV